MKQIVKRGVSIFISILMLTTLLPYMVSADPINDNYPEINLNEVVTYSADQSQPFKFIPDEDG